MAEELRGTQYFNSTTSSVAGAEIIANTADRDMFIRFIGNKGTVITTGAETDMRFHSQIGKNNAITTTDAASGVKFQTKVGLNAVTSGQFAKDFADTWYLAKGQFVLEPGESLYLNTTVNGTPDTLEQMVDVWYHY